MPATKVFRRKPVVVSAYQADREMVVQTLEGPLQAVPGDWIITGIKGEQYPCKPEIFERLYEPFAGQVEALARNLP
jgi:hypothetical protein